MTKRIQKRVHLHMVSDATGETVDTITRACLARFPDMQPVEHLYALVTDQEMLEEACAGIAANPGPVLYTLASDPMRRKLQAFCHAKKIAAIPAIEPTIEALASCLGLEGEADRPGSQHVMDDNYFRRIEALDFAIAHDDGQGLETLDQADVVLTGVSRTSKTPTCFYLAQRGVKAANVPLVPALPVPERLESLQGPLVVGLTAQPSRLVHVRRQRFSQKAARAAESYTDKSNVENEARFALQVFSRHQWPMVDVTHCSVEETAAKIGNLMRQREERALQETDGS